ncbi:MAG: hypothetical protein ACJ8AB_05925 [Gemmatimonadaceae bacterium]
MRRRLSLVLLTIIVALGVAVSRYYFAARARSATVVSTGSARDSIARRDSLARENNRQDVDTMCMASRIGLPCDTH